MILKQNLIADAIEGKREFKDDRLYIIPLPSLSKMKKSGSASIDLRLGRWFSILRGTRHLGFKITQDGDISLPTNRVLNEADLTQRQFVPFDNEFVLHPGTFALGGTLEWIKIPKICAATILGKSSWGRRGLIIETAPIVHPGFSGCLTLELTNVGHIPISLRPSIAIAQLVVHRAEGVGAELSSFDGFRRPSLGSIRLDDFTQTLMSS